MSNLSETPKSELLSLCHWAVDLGAIKTVSFTPQSHLCNDSFNGPSLYLAMCHWSGASYFCIVLHVWTEYIPWGWHFLGSCKRCIEARPVMQWRLISSLMCKSVSDLVLLLELTCFPLWIWLQGGEAGIADSLDDYTLMRWLKAESNDVDKAESRLRKHAIWREENFPEGRVLEVSVLPPVSPFIIIHWTIPNVLLVPSGAIRYGIWTILCCVLILAAWTSWQILSISWYTHNLEDTADC